MEDLMFVPMSLTCTLKRELDQAQKTEACHSYYVIDQKKS